MIDFNVFNDRHNGEYSAAQKRSSRLSSAEPIKDQVVSRSHNSASSGSSSSSKRARQLLNHTYFLLLIAEAILIALIAIQLVWLERLVVTGMEHTTWDQIQLLELHYDIKVDQMGFAFAVLAESPDAVNTMENPTSDNIAQFEDFLEREVSNRQLEYSTMVDTSGTIVAGANADRHGKSWDPCGVVSTFLQSPELGQLKASCILDFHELDEEQAPLWRDAESSYDALQHMYDTNEDGVVRWIVTGFELE